MLRPIGNAPAGRVTAVAAVARYARVIAHPGQGAALAAHLPGAADGLASDPGCVLYLVNREKANPDIIWVTEIWRSQADLDASLARIRGGERAAAAMTMVKDWQMIELDSLGGKGLQLLLTDQRHMTKEKCASASIVYGVRRRLGYETPIARNSHDQHANSSMPGRRSLSQWVSSRWASRPCVIALPGMRLVVDGGFALARCAERPLLAFSGGTLSAKASGLSGSKTGIGS